MTHPSEEKLIALYVELTGENEAAARNVYSHLGLVGHDSGGSSHINESPSDGHAV